MQFVVNHISLYLTQNILLCNCCHELFLRFPNKRSCRRFYRENFTRIDCPKWPDSYMNVFFMSLLSHHSCKYFPYSKTHINFQNSFGFSKFLLYSYISGILLDIFQLWWWPILKHILKILFLPRCSPLECVYLTRRRWNKTNEMLAIILRSS